VPVQRHRLDSPEEPSSLGRDYPLLTGNLGEVPRALDRDHAVMVFTGEQAARQAGDARRIGEQPPDGEMRLAGVRMAQNGLTQAAKSESEPDMIRMFGCPAYECKR
jgi:hypothetical protein